ncbi:hypothetical protein V6U90_15915 [Micromonospora sp. CPCC 206060]|uniref:hypothetical protein n=1 Tax=Micromonospora sp. CPCC 206060 TaxID=3122406 RepID=UPI002FF24C00
MKHEVGELLLPRKRTIEVLTLAQRIAAEVESGRVDDVEMEDETLRQVAAMLRPPSVLPANGVLKATLLSASACLAGTVGVAAGALRSALVMVGA